MTNGIFIGRIVKAQGIKGEVKVVSYVANQSGFLSLKRVFIDELPREIVRARVCGSDVFLLLKGVTDRNAAELLREKEIELPLSEAQIFKKHGYFIGELIGIKVFCGGVCLGEITDVLQNGAADVLVVKGKKPFMVPFLKKLVSKTDIEGKIMEFNQEVLAEVVTYED